MRARSGVTKNKRRKKILKQAKGFRGGRKRLYRTAKNAVMKAGLFAYRDRRQRKRHFRALWIQRIHAALLPYGIRYSEFIHKLKEKNIALNRKSLADLAAEKPEIFKAVVDQIKE